jgi:hypothetical protein
LLPFLIGIPLAKYSPYLEENSMQTYVIIWITISIAIVSVTMSLLKHSFKSFGTVFFLLACPIVGIIGLASPPDVSLKMLEHPEREHVRYLFLFIAAILFGVFSLFVFKNNSLGMKKSTKSIMILFLILAFSEFIWEFTHHYLYPEALQDWIAQGSNAEEFSKNYDDATVISIGVLGRFIQFSLTIWLSLNLYKSRQIKIWNPIITIVFGLLGIISAIVVYATQMNIPKGFEILFLFFIPGMPFLLMYWLGVAIVTKFRKSEIGTQQNQS